MHSACCIPASGRDERDILDRAKLVCTFSQPLQMLSLKALCKCMHECLTQALTRTVASFTKSRLIFFRASFTYKLCDTNSSNLSVWSSFAPFCICTTVPNGLPVLAFADSKRSHCKWIPNDSKPLLKLIRRDAFSANITIVHRIGCSLNLNISYYCSFVFWEYGCGLLSMGKQSIGKLSRMSGHPLFQKARTFGLGPPLPLK